MSGNEMVVSLILLGLVRQTRAAVLHAGDLRVRVLRMRPLVLPFCGSERT